MADRALGAALPRSAIGTAQGPVGVKLGGSVIRSRELESWLDAILHDRGRVVVVPGGGALADEVRMSQSRLGFDDMAAHRMALLAMDQLAWAVAGLRSCFDVVVNEAQLVRSLGAGRIPVWAPYQLVANRADIPQSWSVTSDSLAVWLAGRIGAPQCYLIKSIDRSFARIGAQELSRREIVDSAFPDMLRQAGVSAFVLGRGDQAAFSSRSTMAGAIVE